MKIIPTADGSTTLLSERTGDLYHCKKGAEAESVYVYIDKGLNCATERFPALKILEVGMGTGLNVMLTYQYAREKGLKDLNYLAIEPYPIDGELLNALTFPVLNQKGNHAIYHTIHRTCWNDDLKLTKDFSFRKEKIGLLDLDQHRKFNLVYYDAFGPTYEPELWTMECMEKIKSLMDEGGVLVSYCAQGNFRRNLQSLGFEVERLDGPLGKWEMIRAFKV